LWERESEPERERVGVRGTNISARKKEGGVHEKTWVSNYSFSGSKKGINPSMYGKSKGEYPRRDREAEDTLVLAYMVKEREDP